MAGLNFCSILLTLSVISLGYFFNSSLAQPQDPQILYANNSDNSFWRDGTQNPLDLTLHQGKDCARVCVEGEPPKICYFKFNLEHFQAMGPACGRCADGVLEDCFQPGCIPVDGIEKGVMSINRQIPGPLIEVCKNDQIVVDVVNLMGGTSSTIHWHGPHQRKTPFMDGVPFITQCPIPYATTFRYNFEATESGTQFYHSHTGHEKVEGIYGGLIIREAPGHDPNGDLYDRDLSEHVIVISDWMHEAAAMFMPGLPTRPGGIMPDSVLINGHGQYIDPKNKKATKVPLYETRVQQKTAYRLRIINAASHVCPLTIQIENHKMRVIASDSYNVHPVLVDTLLITSGERYDVIVETDQLPRDYFIRVRAVGPCTSRQIEQFGIWSYDLGDNVEKKPPKRKIPDFNKPYPDGVYLNHPNSTCMLGAGNDLCVSDLVGVARDDELRRAIPDHKFYLAFDNYRVSMEDVYIDQHYKHFMNIGRNILLVGAINNISFTFPSISLLTQPDEIREDMFCEEGNIPESCAGRQICPCLHRIKIQLNSVVDLVIVDETLAVGSLHHPFHLHGYPLLVMNMGQHPKLPMTRKLARDMDMARVLPVTSRIDHNPPRKDTVAIPSRGFVVLRFRADNPGFWLMHCHFEWHMAVGMALVLQVGEVDDMVKAPEGFPKCGNFMPDIY